MLAPAEQPSFCKGLGENFTTGCTMGTAKICESMRFTGDIICLRALWTGVFEIFRSATLGSGGFRAQVEKKTFPDGRITGTHTGGVDGGVTKTGVENFSNVCNRFCAL